jgi:secreted PhoX family phosphatase
MKESQQREVTMPKEDKNQNGKRNTEMKITGKKARKLSKKREKIEKLQKVPEGTSQKEGFQNLNFVGISVQCTHGTSPWRSNIAVGNSITIRPTPRMVRMTFMVRKSRHQTIGTAP